MKHVHNRIYNSIVINYKGSFLKVSLSLSCFLPVSVRASLGSGKGLGLWGSEAEQDNVPWRAVHMFRCQESVAIMKLNKQPISKISYHHIYSKLLANMANIYVE